MPNTLYDALLANRRTSTAPFLQLPGRADLSYQAFADLAAQLANVLVAKGVEAGDRVAVQTGKSAEALALYVGCVQCGAVYLPLNTAYTANEVSYFVNDAEPRLLVCEDSASASLATIAADAGARLETLNSDGSGSLGDAAQNAPSDFATVNRQPGDLAAILYTSGTTGRSKGAMMSHDNLLSNARTLVEYWQFSSQDTLLHALPIYHTHGLFVASNVCMLSGASIIFLPSFNLDQMIEWLPHANTMMGVPTFYTRLLGDPRFDRQRTAHMRVFISGSAPLLAETHEAFEQRTGHRILERYGMTETNMNTSNPYHGERRAGTVGFPLPGVSLKICAPDSGRELPQGEVGIIEVKGANVFSGYWRMPDKTAEDLRENGFLITGDLGKIDADGYVQIVGRNKDLVISGGFNIYPKEVELALDEQSGVLESAVIGAPHADFGEGVVAVLVTDGSTAIELDQIRDNMAKQLARFKQPKQYYIIDELPRNTMGKVQKNILREQFANAFQN